MTRRAEAEGASNENTEEGSTAGSTISWTPLGGTGQPGTTLPPWLYSAPAILPNSLYLYFDESGNLDFKSSGTPYFIMTCAVTSRPFNAGGLLANLRFDLIEHGHPLEKFHACEDNRVVRSAVVDVLSAVPDSYKVYVAYVEKAVLPDEMKTPDTVYSKVFELLVDEVAERELSDSVKQVIAITDSLPQDARKRQVAKPLKRYMKQRFQDAGTPYFLLHHMSCSDPNLQAADYFCWAAHRDLTQGKDWPLTKLSQSFREVGKIGFGSTEKGPTSAGPSDLSHLSETEEPLGFVSTGRNLSQ